MEEVPAHVHPDATVPDVLIRQHEHRCLCRATLGGAHQIGRALVYFKLGLVCVFLYYVLNDRHVELDPCAPLGAMWCTSFDLSQLLTHVLLTYRDQLNFIPSDQPVPAACDTRLILHRLQLKGNDHTYWATEQATHVEVWNQWRQYIRDGLLLPIEDLSSPRDDYIRWYRDFTRVYIDNLACCDTQTFEYQLAGVKKRMMTSILQEVDDMTTRVLERHHHLRLDMLVS
ncbi:hypothetical protein M9H77_12259 [Catharanthus roseus]|uniref:Uncharacterized protein n=1 Tax=Catharanthus roseus TaxID=4058 RepID=A0ACC0BGZ5_CATRO|nr:hypothetical protein M9H77_12259 [Catharanthus roseus]